MSDSAAKNLRTFFLSFQPPARQQAVPNLVWVGGCGWVSFSLAPCPLLLGLPERFTHFSSHSPKYPGKCLTSLGTDYTCVLGCAFYPLSQWNVILDVLFFDVRYK